MKFMFKLHITLNSGMKSCAVSVPLRTGISPLSSISTLYTLPAHKSLRIHLGYQINYLAKTVHVFKSPLFYLIMTPKYKSNDLDILL